MARLRRNVGGKCNDDFVVANLTTTDDTVSENKLWKSVDIWWSARSKLYAVFFFLITA